MLTAFRSRPRTHTVRSRAGRLATVALLLWLGLQVPVIWLGNPFGALLVLTLITWGVWAAAVAAAVLPRAGLRWLCSSGSAPVR